MVNNRHTKESRGKWIAFESTLLYNRGLDIGYCGMEHGVSITSALQIDLLTMFFCFDSREIIAVFNDLERHASC